jgi:hypothetical protein
MIFDKMFEECIAVYNAFINELNEYSISIIPKVIRDVKNTFVNFTVDQHSIIENLTVASIPAISPIKPQYKSTRAYLEIGEIVPIKIHNIKTTEIECTKETCGCTHLVLSTKHI